MALPGKFDVSSSGAAGYQIPIAVPPGTAGMAPTLTLAYSSQGGNGLVGLGWSLSGLPAIARCPKTFIQDAARAGVAFTSNDRFCLDGQRLVAISGPYGANGTEYRTEIESYSKIISYGTAGTGPAWFEVRTKSGQVMEFGHTADSLILAQGKTTARGWALNKVSDSKGNYFTVTYTNDTTNGQAYPTRVDYTGNSAASLSPYNSVQLTYATRPDIVPTYRAGSLSKTTVRLTNVKTYSGVNLVSDYRLTYQLGPSTQRSQLTTVTLCAADNSCMPVTTMTWPTATSGTFSGQYNNPVMGSTYFGTPPESGYTPIVGDFNGDGKIDYMFIAGVTQHVFLSNGNGTFTTGLNSSIVANADFGSPPSASYIVVQGDFNGDGLHDYMLVGANSQRVFLSNGNGTFSTLLNQPVLGASNFGSPPQASYTPVVGDFNGDSLTDYMLIAGTTQHVFLSNGNGTFTGRLNSNIVPNADFGSPPSSNYLVVGGDFNGDGLSDYMLVGANTQRVFLSDGDGTFSTQLNQPVLGESNFGTPPQAGYSPVVGDFNGDGLTDYMLVANATQHVFLSNGDGTFAGRLNTSVAANASFGSPPSASYSVVGGDFNSDGLSDYMILGADTQRVFLSNGDGTFRTYLTQPVMGASNFGTPPNAYYSVIGGDFDGDGAGDYLLAAGTSQHVFIASPVVFDVMNSVSNGVGVTTSITYKPLTNAAVYTKDAAATYPMLDMQAAVYVVSRVDVSNGVGGSYSTTYSYVGAKVDASGRGFLGFRQMKMTDLQTSIVNIMNFRQDFPYIGSTSSASKVLGAQTLSASTQTYQFSNASGAASVSTPSVASAPYRVSVAQNVATGNDLDGTVLPTVTTGYQYDAYGNTTQVMVSTPDGFSKTTANAYTNNTTNWFLGRLTASTVTSQTP